jgi:GSCFA family
MQLQIPIEIKSLLVPISYRDKISLMGSCFTEHIGNALGELKFNVMQNPNGILFGPDAVCKSLSSYIENKKYAEADLFYLNEVWNSWAHHSRFSHIDKQECLNRINQSQQTAHDFLKNADWLIITLGSSFTYELTATADAATDGLNGRVANCHRAPANWFKKRMIEMDEIKKMLEECIAKLKIFNPQLKLIFTVSPVRHIRDGVVENNRSKARLIETVHSFLNESIFYFPAYELVIDVLRDYRFYDIDLVHPNYAATEFVLEKFIENYIDLPSQELLKEVKKIVIARKHKAFQPATNAHKQFLQSNYIKAQELQAKHPFLDFDEERSYFEESFTP